MIHKITERSENGRERNIDSNFRCWSKENNERFQIFFFKKFSYISQLLGCYKFVGVALFV